MCNSYSADFKEDIYFVSNLELKTIGQVVKLTITTQIMKSFLWDNGNFVICYQC